MERYARRSSEAKQRLALQQKDQGSMSEKNEICETPATIYRIGQAVQTIPDTAIGEDSSESTTLCGHITSLDFSDEKRDWLVTIKSLHDGRSCTSVPASRVTPLSVGGMVVDGRRPKGAGEKRKLEAAEAALEKKMNYIRRLEAELEEAKADLPKLKKAVVAHEKINKEVTAANKLLAIEANEVSVGVLRQRNVVSKKARSIQREHEELMLACRQELDFWKTKAATLETVNADLLETAKKTKVSLSQLKKDLKEARQVVQRQEKFIEELQSDARMFEKDSVSDFNAALIKTLLAPNVSTRAAAEIEGKSQSTSSRMLQMLGPMQDIVNAMKIALCVNVRELCFDESCLSWMTTLCVGIIIETGDVAEKVILAASALPRNKTSDSCAEMIMLVVSRMQEKYALFLQYCQETGAADVSNFPSPELVTLKKMKQFSAVLTDNASTAKLSAAKLISLVRDLVEGDFTEDQLDAMNEGDRKRVVRCLLVGCFPHIRCLLANEAVKAETEYLKDKIGEQAQHLRMEANLSSLIFATQKNFRRGIDQYAKGQQSEFLAWLKDNKPNSVVFNAGRAGTGSRMDAEFECAYLICLNVEEYLEFLMADDHLKAADEKTILSASIRQRLGSIEFIAPLVCRARFWLSLFAPLRVLFNSTDLDGVGLKDMGAVLDATERAMEMLIDRPYLMRQQSFHVFDTDAWPCLEAYYEAHKVKKKLSVDNTSCYLLSSVEDKKIYSCSTAEEEIITELVRSELRIGVTYNSYSQYIY
jgi:hypothetical protein